MAENSFAERLQEIAQAFESKAALAKKAGIPITSLQSYMSGSEPGRVALVALADAAGVSVHWLATGEGPQSASIAPEGYIEVPCFNLSGVGPYARGMFGNPTGTRLFKRGDFPERVSVDYENERVRLAAVEGCLELSFEPAILSADVFIFEEVVRIFRAPDVFKLWPILNRAEDIYLIADGGNLRLRRLIRKGSISARDLRRASGSISISVIAPGAPDGRIERTLTGALGDFHFFGRVIWRSGMLPGAAIPASGVAPSKIGGNISKCE
jgi:hypothetical protein